MTKDVGRSPDGSGSRPTDEAAISVASSPKASIPNALDGLRAATIALIIAVEQDAQSDWPGDVDCSHLDRAWEAIDATYPTIWMDEQVAAVQAWQDCGSNHPLTCINHNNPWHKDEDGVEVLPVATPQGLVCRSCGYRQFDVPEVCFRAQAIEARRAETLKDGSAGTARARSEGCAQ